MPRVHFSLTTAVKHLQTNESLLALRAEQEHNAAEKLSLMTVIFLLWFMGCQTVAVSQTGRYRDYTNIICIHCTNMHTVMVKADAKKDNKIHLQGQV